MMSACVETIFGCLELQITTKRRKYSKNSSAGHRNTSRVRHHVKQNENMAGCLKCTRWLVVSKGLQSAWISKFKYFFVWASLFDVTKCQRRWKATAAVKSHDNAVWWNCTEKSFTTWFYWNMLHRLEHLNFFHRPLLTIFLQCFLQGQLCIWGRWCSSGGLFCTSLFFIVNISKELKFSGSLSFFPDHHDRALLADFFFYSRSERLDFCFGFSLLTAFNWIALDGMIIVLLCSWFAHGFPMLMVYSWFSDAHELSMVLCSWIAHDSLVCT